MQAEQLLGQAKPRHAGGDEGLKPPVAHMASERHTSLSLLASFVSFDHSQAFSLAAARHGGAPPPLKDASSATTVSAKHASLQIPILSVSTSPASCVIRACSETQDAGRQRDR